jgi:hypothetical protein
MSKNEVVTLIPQKITFRSPRLEKLETDLDAMISKLIPHIYIEECAVSVITHRMKLLAERGYQIRYFLIPGLTAYVKCFLEILPKVDRR